MNRYVKRGSKGIALIASTGTRLRLKYVFDYSNTSPSRENAKSLFLVKISNKHKADVSIIICHIIGECFIKCVNGIISKKIFDNNINSFSHTTG